MADAGSFNADLGINMQFNIDGAGLVEMTKTIKEISKGKDLQRYWKDVESATDSAAKAIERYNKNVDSKRLAENFLKEINALKAITKNENLSELFPDMNVNFDGLIKSAKKVAPQINSEFSTSKFEQAFNTFDLLKEKGIELGEVFRQLSDYANLLKSNIQLSQENDNFRSLIGDADIEKIKEDLREIQTLRLQAEKTFDNFLDLNNIEKTDMWGDDRFPEYFSEIRNGSITVTEAIARFKTEYGYLLEESFRSSGNTLGLEQLQAFSIKLDSIFHQVEETSNKINDIISNGVITKSVQNLSENPSLSDSQRSIFGNLLQDEETLKSITTLIQNLIAESNKVKNTEIFNSEQFTKIEGLFENIESHLSSIKKVFVDVGDGNEFSPLLSTIDKINSSISELSSSVKNIGFNMNIDVGSDTELEAKIQSKMSNALQAYQRLFEHIKMSGIGGSMVNTNFFEFDINQFDTMMAKIQAYRKFIENMRNQVKSEFGGKDLLYTETDKKYWTSAAAAMGQLTKAQNEMNKSVDANPLDDLFGKTDLTGVIEQLNLIISKLDEISVAATKFLETFSQGLNVTTSVEEITKLTEKVKELEIKLAKVKSVSTGSSESNISSGNSFQINVAPTSITSADAIQKENDALEATAQKATEAATSKEKFSEANQQVKESADESVSSIKDEADAFSQAEWDKNVQAIQDYMDAVTKLNNLKAKDKDTGKDVTNISRQEQEVEKLKEAAYEARAALTSMINPHDVDIDTWKDWVNAMKQFDQASLGSAESVAKLEDALRNASDARKNYINSVKDKHTGYSNDYQNALSKDGYLPTNAFKEKVAKYQALCNKLIESADDLSQKDIVSQEQLDSFEELKRKCEDARQELTKMSASDKGAWAVDVQKEISKITKELHENSNFSDEAKQKLQAFIDQLNAGDISDTTLKKIHEEFLRITNAEKAAGREGKNFIDILKNSGIHKIAADLVGMFSVYDLINLGKQASSIVIDLNTQITELAKVSEATSSQIYDDFSSYADIAKNVRGTISDTISATADWSKNGYSIPDSKQLAEISQLYKNVGDGINIDEANESLISTLKGFQLAVDQAEDIVDVFNEVSNNEAISSAGIGQALQRSAASFNAANTSLEKSVALVTATNSVLQDPEKVGNMWRTVSARLRGSETELKEMGEDTDGLVESTSKLQSLVKGITGFDIMKDKDTYKDIYDIVLGIGESWKDLSDIDRASLLEALAGKQQSNALAAALSNIDILKKSYKEATHAEGSARKENEEYAKSIQASIDLAKAKLEELSNDLLSSSFLKGAIDAGGKLIDILDDIVKSGNAIPAIFTAIGAGLSFKNIGKCYVSA